MHNIIITKPYRFVPPARSGFWPRLLWRVLPRYLDRSHAVESFEILGADRLKASLEARHAIVLTPNHCLEEIERRLTWRAQKHTPLLERITRIGNALLTLKEIEYIGRQQTLEIGLRLKALIDALLVPLEKENAARMKRQNASCCASSFMPCRWTTMDRSERCDWPRSVGRTSMGADRFGAGSGWRRG